MGKVKASRNAAGMLEKDGVGIFELSFWRFIGQACRHD